MRLYLSACFLAFGLFCQPVTAQELPPPAPAPKQEKPENKPNISDLHKPKGARDLTVRSEADRKQMLHSLFIELKNALSEEDAKIIAEEIWAVWLQSGSASVDFLLHRGIAAQNKGDFKLARRMYDYVIDFAPDYAEAWSRSGRLAAETEDLNRAVNDTIKALTLEPRHFYALWTLGNILEMLGKPEQAFEVYEQAYEIYPMHEQIKQRYERLKEAAKGKAL